jgi:tRNA A-37 threonylcarbamoyl transferase component Bud32/outer membrane protein assembly factor BamB
MSTEPNAGGGAPVAIADALIGKEIDGCTIVKKIGQGGMGIVYLAEHSKLRQQYVVKILNPALTAAEDTVQRFFREAQSVARLNHHGIVGIQNVGQEGDYYYIRMEYVDGDTVENIIKKEHKLDWHLATKIVLDTAEALSHAHKKGVVHRDIKPENIMLTQQGEVKVMDFGLAKQVQAATKVSVTGQIVGTPFFMSPEQAGGKTVDARSDIYSLGVSYYYMLTGVKPFNGKNLQEIFLKHFFYQPESPKIHTPDVPENVCEVIRRCLKKKKKERYQSAAHFMKDLQAVLEGGELSAPEAADSASETIAPTASAPDMKPEGGFAATSSDPAVPAMGGDTVSREVAAARAEIGGAGDPGTIVAEGAGAKENGSITVVARGGTQAADEKAAPLTKREGRVQLAEVAGASLVFGKKPEPPPAKSPTGAPGDQATAVAPKKSPSSSSTPDLAAIEAVTGSKKPGTETVEKKPPVVKKGPPKAVIGAVVAVLALGAGVYEGVGFLKYGSLTAAFQQLQSTRPSPEDDAGWQSLMAESAQLAEQFESFQSTFRYFPRAEAAGGFATKCREVSELAKTSYSDAVKSKAIAGQDLERQKQLLKEMAIRREKLDAAKVTIDGLLKEKKYEDAGKKAVEAWEVAQIDKRQGEFKVPVEVSCDLPGVKLYDGGSNQELPVLPGRGQAVVVMAPINSAGFKLEARRPKFSTWRADQTFNGYTRLAATLDRVISHRLDLGKTKPFWRFHKQQVDEPVCVVGEMTIDPQTPPTLDFVSQDGLLRSFELKTGRPRWDPQKIGDYGDPTPGPDVLPGKAVATVSADGWVRAYDVGSGGRVAEAPLGAPVIAGCRVDSQPSYLIAGTVTGEIVCIELGSAKPERWRIHAEGPIATRPLILGDRVFVGSKDDRLRAIDPTNGSVIASYDAREAISAGPIARGNTLLVGTFEGRVHAVNVSDFSVNSTVHSVFTTAAAGHPILQLTLAGSKGIFYATTEDLRGIDASGNNLFSTPFVPQDNGVPLEIAGICPMNEAIGVVTINGKVFSVDMKTGTQNWVLDLNADQSKPPVTISVPPLFDGTDLYVATSGGEVIAVVGD